MGKYIIEVSDAYIRHALGRKLIIPVIINNDTEYWVNTNIQLTPYTEPDTEKVREEAYTEAKIDAGQEYENGYDAGHNVGYQQGLSDAWEAARKIAISEESGGLACREMQRIFCTDETDEIFDMSASEAIEKIRQYEQEQEEIQVGDEVISEDDIKAVVIDMDDYLLHVLDENGVMQGWPREDVAETGRHFPEIAAVLTKMKEES